MAIEYQLDPFILPEVKSLNDRIVISLSSSSSLLDKLVGLMGQYIDILANPVRFPVRGAKVSLTC